MAATKSAKNPTPHNDTPNTPKVREGAIAKMKVDELRHKLRGHGVKGTADLKKPELVKQLIKAEVAATKKSTTKKSTTAKQSSTAKPSSTAKQGAAAKKSATAKPGTAAKKSSPAKQSAPAAAVTKATSATKTAAKKSTTKNSTAKKSTAKNPTPGNDTPNTPDVSETAIAALKVDELRRKLRGHGVKGTAELKKPELVKQLTKIEVTGAKKKAARKKK